MPELPPVFIDRIKQIIPQEYQQDVMRNFTVRSPYVLRLNGCKAEPAVIRETLQKEGLPFEDIPSLPAVVIGESSTDNPALQKILDAGLVYKQSVASMLPALVLDPHPQDYILDLCAAPGSKTSQIADMMKNQGVLIAVEHIRPRYYRLQSVLRQLGVTVAQTKLMDGRRYRSHYLFDKILVDAPCSSEGRFKVFEPESYAYWSPRKIKEMVQKQRGILLNASRLLKSGGTLVYSTCTFAPEENEGVVDWLLRKTDGSLKLVPIKLDGIMTYPALLTWEKRTYNDQLQHGYRVLPTDKVEGFFIAKLIKN